jgi:hypothetical protein
VALKLNWTYKLLVYADYVDLLRDSIDTTKKGPVEGSFEHSNEPSGSIKYCEVLELLHVWQLLKKDSAP